MLTLQPDNPNASKAREFAFSDDDFNALRTLVKAHTGINLTDQKRSTEPYSLAMTLRETLADAPGRWDIRILATDLDSDVLGRGQCGVYPAERPRDVSPARVSRFFRQTTLNGQPAYTAAAELRELITFRQLNLMTEFPMKGPLDAIFCRNVVIYFDKDTQRDLFARMSRLQESGAILFLGHSESLFKVSTDYSLIGKTIYRRV
jgi:chemotaxis protein methyltransferase CheR